MVDLEQKTSIKANFSCESRYNAVVTPTGPFFSNTQQNPQLFWPNEDYTGIAFCYVLSSLNNIITFYV